MRAIHNNLQTWSKYGGTQLCSKPAAASNSKRSDQQRRPGDELTHTCYILKSCFYWWTEMIYEFTFTSNSTLNLLVFNNHPRQTYCYSFFVKIELNGVIWLETAAETRHHSLSVSAASLSSTVCFWRLPSLPPSVPMTSINTLDCDPFFNRTNWTFWLLTTILSGNRTEQHQWNWLTSTCNDHVLSPQAAGVP